MKLIRRRTTPAMRAANGTNAARSTGPRTARGKSITRCNALKHWGRAEGMRDLMPALGEDPGEFQALLDGLGRSLAPADDFEEMLVKDMADIQWRLRRSIRAETANQAKRRRQEMQRLDQLNAQQENGGSLSPMERLLAPMAGFTGLPDSPAKFYRVIELLKSFHALVGYNRVGGEGAAYLRALYGPTPSPAGQSLISSFERYRAANESPLEVDDVRKAERAAGIVASRQDLLAALEAEIAWFEKRAAADRQARAELAGPSVESEMLYTLSAPDRVMLYQERQERRFEKKWELLVRYRRWRQCQPECEIEERLEEVPPTSNAGHAPKASAAEAEHAGTEKNTKMYEQSRQVIENMGSAISENPESRQSAENAPVTESVRQNTENKGHRFQGLPPRTRRRR